MLFIESRPNRFRHLQTVLAPMLARAALSGNVRTAEPQPGDCDTVLNAMLDDCERQGIHFGPALAFLDQFGYGAVSMELISRIMKYA
jgi:three-Cys-motif partner protein